MNPKPTLRNLIADECEVLRARVAELSAERGGSKGRGMVDDIEESIRTWCGGGSYVPSTPDSRLDDDVATLLQRYETRVAELEESVAGMMAANIGIVGQLEAERDMWRSSSSALDGLIKKNYEEIRALRARAAELEAALVRLRERLRTRDPADMALFDIDAALTQESGK